MSIFHLLTCWCAKTVERQLSSLTGSATFTAATNLTKVFEDLQCPVCFSICVPPIHNCANGHILCNNCRQKGHVTRCPTCRETFTGTRNYFAENFVLNYAQQCRFASQGCEHLKFKGCNMRSHEQQCMFRPVRCIVQSCTHDIPYKNFLAHLDCAHKVSGTDTIPATVKFVHDARKHKNSSWMPFYIQAYDNLYYVMLRKKQTYFCIWLYSQTQKESEDIEFQHFADIKFMHPDPDKKISQSWYGPVNNIRTPFSAIFSQGSCFVIPDIAMKSLASKQEYNFTVNIEKSPRRNFKDLNISETSCAVMAPVSSPFPDEYGVPPSFYEPSEPRHQLSVNASAPALVAPSTLDENGNVIDPLLSAQQEPTLIAKICSGRDGMHTFTHSASPTVESVNVLSRSWVTNTNMEGSSSNQHLTFLHPLPNNNNNATPKTTGVNTEAKKSLKSILRVR